MRRRRLPQARPRTLLAALPHFRGKSKTFIKRADVILEVEGVGFLAHTDVLLMQCGTVFEGLCREFLQVWHGSGPVDVSCPHKGLPPPTSSHARLRPQPLFSHWSH